MKRINIGFILLAVAILLGGFLRFHELGHIPSGLHRDEAFLGYNAYSLLRTGNDMTGAHFPLHFRSFLYSPGGYSYLSIPFIAVFGLSAYSVRFVSALFGSLSIVLVALMVFQFSTLQHRKAVGILSAFLLAVSPWHINLSRTATEHIPVLFFILLGIWLYRRSLNSKRISLVLLSFASFSITLTMYQAPRIFLPLFLPILLWNFPEKNRIGNRTWLLFVLCIVIPIVIIFKMPNLGLRIQTVSVFASQGTQLTLDEAIREDGVLQIKPIASRLFHNKLIGYGQAVIQNYFDHFTYKFLFTDAGFPDRYRVPGVGLLYIFELPIILLGLITLLKNKSSETNVVFGWLLLAPIGSALTFDDIPNLQRTVVMIIPIVIFTAVGICTIWETVKRISPGKKRILLSGAFTICIFGFAQYLHQYYIHQVVHKPWYRMEGYAELVNSINSEIPKYKKAVISNRESAPTIFMLFYLKYDPALFQRETAHLSTNDFDRVSFGPYSFTTDDCPVRVETITAPNGKIANQLVGETDILYVNAGTCKHVDNPLITYDKTIERSDNSAVFQLLHRTK